MLEIKTVLHPTDFSRSAEQAFRFAVSLARQHRAKLILMHVAQRPVSNVGGMPVIPPPGPAIDFASLDAQLKDAAAHLADLQIETKAVAGQPAEQIVAAARELKADIVVIGSHGRSGLARALMGSVAEHVVRHAACPVLTVKTPAK
jgi:nucleotide-binding universal stress UspA family protein